MEAEIWSLLSSTYRHGNTDRPTFTWVWIIATVFFSFLLLVKFKKRVIQQKCSLFAIDSRRLLRMKRFHSDQSRHHQFSGFCLRRLQSATQNYVWSSYGFPSQNLLRNQQITTEGIANDATDYSYWDRERSLNALERESGGRGRWPLIACMQMPSAKCQKARMCQ